MLGVAMIRKLALPVAGVLLVALSASGGAYVWTTRAPGLAVVQWQFDCGSSVNAVAFSPSGKLATGGSSSVDAAVFSLETGRPVGKLAIADGLIVQGFAFSRDDGDLFIGQ